MGVAVGVAVGVGGGVAVAVAVGVGVVAGVGVGEGATALMRTLSRRRSIFNVFGDTSVNVSVVEVLLAVKV
jgi:hypothetical protein